MSQQTDQASNPKWSTYGADEWADAVVASMKLGGVDNLFFVSGSEIGFYQEAIAKANDRKWPTPKLIMMMHESVALNAALGNTMVSGKPAATAVHVDVGTFNYGGALHTAWRGGYPVLITAGTGPRAYSGTMRGSRNAPVQWVQEPRDQGEIVRQYTKMDHRMEHQDNPGMLVSRLLQVAMSEPKGPVYLSLPQETAMLPMPGSTRFPTRDEMGVARQAWPDPTDARKAAEWLIKSDNPCVYTSKSGRNPESVEDLVRLAELLALPVMAGNRIDRLNFPTTHPLYGSGPQPNEADVILVIENPAPFTPPNTIPTPNAKTIWVDPDPVQSRYKTMEWQADLWLPVAASGAARAIYEVAASMLTKADMDRIEQRRGRLEKRHKELMAAEEAAALKAYKRSVLHPRYVAYEIGKLLEPGAILLDDALSNSAYVNAYHGRSQTGTFFKSGGSSGGWGSGAAFGAKLAAPDRDVVLATGDGYFMFGTPMPALWSAAHYKQAFLTVVFVNRSYSTGTYTLDRMYPDGVTVRTGNYEGGIFDPPPNFAKLAEAANGYGESVSEADEVGPALRRGLEQTRNGIPAIVAVNLPTLVEEMGMQ